MAFEPISIFSHRIDPTGVAELVRRFSPKATIAGPADDWSDIEVVTRKGGLFRRKRTFALGHNAEYYDGEGWPQQIMGMQGYFSDFPETQNKADIFRLIRSFRFSLSVPVEDLNIDSDDQRLELLYAVCRHLDAAIFTPSSLRDSSGRILIDAEGFVDSNAVMPALPPTDDLSDATHDATDDEDDYEEPEPPTPVRVAQRTLVLAAVSSRATMELDVMREVLDVKDAEIHRERLLNWIDDLDVDDEFEPQEWKVLQTPVGSLEQQDFVNAMWRVEGLAVLAWVLQLQEIPAYDELVVPVDLRRNWSVRHRSGKETVGRSPLAFGRRMHRNARTFVGTALAITRLFDAP